MKTNKSFEWVMTPTIEPAAQRLAWYQRGAAVFALYNYVVTTGLMIATLAGALPAITWVPIGAMLLLAFVGVAWDNK